MNDYRNTMTAYLGESFRMIQKVLSEADFYREFPHVFGHPRDDPTLSVRNRCGLLLRKAELHVVAALRANEDNNLHSLAIHTRVILECAAHLLSVTGAAYEGSPNVLQKTTNAFEYDLLDTMRRLGRGAINDDEIMDMITTSRKEVGNFSKARPTPNTITNRVGLVPNGEWWYGHLSDRFCHGEADALGEDSFYGGVVSANAWRDELALALFLDYLGELVNCMLAEYGMLLVSVSGGTCVQPFDDAIDLWKRARAATKASREALLRSMAPGGPDARAGL